MKRSIENGGKTHVRYAHKHYPKVVELRCKKCGSKMIAKNEDLPPEVDHFIDASKFIKKWNIICTNCTFRSSVDWNELKDYDFWLKTEINGMEFWSWNIDHLKMILKKLKKMDLKSDKWETYQSYIPKKWLVKLSNEKAIGIIEKLKEK